MISITITREDLMSRDACRDELARFDSIWPDGVARIEGSIAYVNDFLLFVSKHWPAAIAFLHAEKFISPLDLRRANLRGANLSYANLRDADLSYADLRGAVMPSNWREVAINIKEVVYKEK